MIDFKAINEKRHLEQGFRPQKPPLQKIKGIRTDHSTGQSKEVELEYGILDFPANNFRTQRRGFFLRGGVTGYESFLLDDDIDPNEEKIPRLIENGWLACAGTKGRWDRLFIPPEEIQRVFRQEGLT